MATIPNNTCSRCGRRLSDPVSLALGIGPECRGKHATPSHRQIATSNRLARGQAYADKQPISFANMTYSFNAEVDGWISSMSGHVVPDKSLKAWLISNKLAVFPDEYLDALKHRRDLLKETIQSQDWSDPDKSQKQSERTDLEEMINELHTIQDILDREEEEVDDGNE